MNKQQLISEIKRKKSYLCVGLDTDVKKIPVHLRVTPEAVFEFNKAIIDATHHVAVAYKPNVAFYECLGPEGWESLKKTTDYIRKNFPDIFIIADAKRGDIGNTSEMYARAFFEWMDCDAITVAPYMGEDSVKPFLNYPGKWVIVLALTSNKGAFDFQFVQNSTTGKPLYQTVIETSQTWAGDDQLMFVAGATKAEMFGELRKMAPQNFFLVPGVGAQGGSLHDVSIAGLNADGGLLVNSSRAIIYASSGTDFAEKACAEAEAVQIEMEQLLRLKGVI